MSIKSNPGATGVQAQETCEQFTKVIRKNYKKQHGVQNTKFKKMGDYYQLRASFKRRQLFAFDLNPEKAMAKFMLEIYRKVFHEKYYPKEEFKKIKDQLQRHVVMQYSVYELPE